MFSLYLLGGLCVVFAASWLVARKTGYGADQRVRRVSYLLIGLCGAAITVQSARGHRYTGIFPAVGALYFLYLWLGSGQARGVTRR